MLFVTVLTGAEPIRLGGGELARDIEFEVTEALSEITSLVGVPGRSSLVIDVRLGWRDGFVTGGNIVVTEEGVAPGVTTGVAGDSVFGVGAILRVLGVLCTTVDGGAAGFSGGNSDADEATVFLGRLSGVAEIVAFGVDFAEMFNMPGVDRFSVDFGAVGVVLEGPVGGFLLATFASLAAEGDAGPLPLIVSRDGKSSD